MVDTFLGHWNPHGGSAALEICPDRSIRFIRWDYSFCTQHDIDDGGCIPFVGSDGILLTAGNLITTCIFLPMALMDLKENAIWQTVGFFVMLVICLQFIVQFTIAGLDWSNASMWGTNWDSLFGVILFNFCLVIAIPAWLYEREPHVDVPTVIHGSNFIATVLYISVGLLGNLALPKVSDNMLQSMMSGSLELGPSMQLGSSIFAFFIIGFGSPLFSVLARLNLTSSGLCSVRLANILAVYLPFGISWFLYDEGTITLLLSWGGVIFTSLVAFILPLLLALDTLTEFEECRGSVQVCFGWFTSDKAARRLLQILFALAVVSIALAIFGNVVSMMADTVDT